MSTEAPETVPEGVHEHGDWDAGGYCNRLVIRDGCGDTCGYRSEHHTVDMGDEDPPDWDWWDGGVGVEARYEREADERLEREERERQAYLDDQSAQRDDQNPEVLRAENEVLRMQLSQLREARVLAEQTIARLRSKVESLETQLEGTQRQRDTQALVNQDTARSLKRIRDAFQARPVFSSRPDLATTMASWQRWMRRILRDDVQGDASIIQTQTGLLVYQTLSTLLEDHAMYLQRSEEYEHFLANQEWEQIRGALAAAYGPGQAEHRAEQQPDQEER